MVVAKSNSDNSIAAADSKELESKNDGLVILAAYIGSDNAIQRINLKIRKQINEVNSLRTKKTLAEIEAMIGALKEDIQTNN